jgi:hypothetical protein
MDDEVKGKGNSVNYKYRMHDPRVGRFFAVDPLASKYPHNSPYAFSENKVIHKIELEGLESADPPLPNKVFEEGIPMSNYKREGALLPLTPPDAKSLTYTFQYVNYGVNGLTGYSTWVYNPDKEIWTGEKREVFKETKAGTRSWEESKPRGCVQNGVFLGNCLDIQERSSGTAHFTEDPSAPGCPVSIVDLTANNITSLFNAIESDARRSVVNVASQKTTSVTVSLNSAIYSNTDRVNMHQNLLKSGLFIGMELKVQLVDNLTVTDGDGDPSQEVGGHVGSTIKTETKLSNGNR